SCARSLVEPGWVRGLLGDWLAEQLDDLVKPSDERVDVLAGAVHVEAGAGRGREVEALVERHRAVVARSDRDPEPIEHLGDIVGMDARHIERNDATPLIGWWS